MKKYLLLVVVFIGCNDSNENAQFNYIQDKYNESKIGWMRNYNNLDSMYFYSGKMHAYQEMGSYFIHH